MRVLVHVMNPHAQVDRCSVLERSEAVGKPGHVCVCSKLQKIGNRQLHQGQGSQDNSASAADEQRGAQQ